MNKLSNESFLNKVIHYLVEITVALLDFKFERLFGQPVSRPVKLSQFSPVIEIVAQLTKFGHGTQNLFGF
jgi:hypothetical protein